MKASRQVITVAALLSSACTQTLTQALARLPSVQPGLPVTVEDTVIAAVLLEALTTGYAHGPQVIIANVEGELTSASLPRVDTLTFLFLNPAPPNKRLKLTGAPKYGRMPFVRQQSIGHRISLLCAGRRCARSLSASR